MIRFVFLFIFLASGVFAQELRLPSNAEMTSDVTTLDAGGDIPTGPWAGGMLPQRAVSGDHRLQTWRIVASGLTSAQIMRNVREQLVNGGFRPEFECATDACGGFDFRFAIEVVRPPAMIVNLSDFRFFAAQNHSNGSSAMVIVSRTREAGFIQLTRVGLTEDLSEIESNTPAIGREVSDVNLDVASQLSLDGRAILDGLAFETGSAQLSSGSFDALSELADYLAANPGLRIALVGHTDSDGSLEGNIHLSKRRAGSVLERLVAEYGVSRQVVAAEGMGYLSPIASNLSEAGREANRRVEVIVLSREN